MRRVDGFYLYHVGGQLHPLAELRAWAMPDGSVPTVGDAILALYVAEAALEPFLSRSVFQFRTCVQAGRFLLDAIRTAKTTLDAAPNKAAQLPFTDIFSVTSAMTTFEAVLGAELGLMPLYVVTPKAGFDTTVLIEAGTRCFPEEIETKAPDAIPDLMQSTRCIAFELFTAAGFHLHRANEAVLRRYWDAVTNNAIPPQSRNMADYINGMNQRNCGDDRVKAALKDLKDLHRNPLIHPEHSLENADEAIALMNGVHTVLVYMLKEIPVVAQLTPAVPPGAVPAPAATASAASSGTTQ